MEFYSKEVRDLITGMIQVNPIHRISLTEIKQHEWFKGEVSTHEEIKENFAQRQKLIEESMPSGELETVDGTTDLDEMELGTFRSIDDEDEEFSAGNHSILRVEAPYIEEYKVLTQFFSTSKLNEIFTTLANFVQYTTQDFKLSPFEYSVQMDFIPEEKEGENKDDFLMKPSKATVSVNILKVSDREMH
mmetsp:Transcript_206/g.251  ORF Transcript_206/g.251 Transcript_206/m.251 type:complete len:189 (+) Transcript_206:211-777(+)